MLGAPARIVIDSGNAQVGAVGESLAKPFIAVVSADLHGRTAEVFYFAGPLSARPDLTGRAPDLVITVPTFDLRNPGSVFGTDPFGLGSSPGRVVRFTGYVKVTPYSTQYDVTLGVSRGARLTMRGVTAIDIPSGTGQFAQTVQRLQMFVSDWVPIQLVTFDNGDVDTQLLLQQTGADGPPVAIRTADLMPAIPSLVTTSDGAGEFSIANVPTAFGTVGVSASFVTASRTRLAREVTPAAAAGGGTTSVGDVQIIPNQTIYVTDPWIPAVASTR